MVHVGGGAILEIVVLYVSTVMFMLNLEICGEEVCMLLVKLMPTYVASAVRPGTGSWADRDR